MEIVIAGGGVAGLEGLLALHRALGDRAHLTLIAPDPDFTYRPMAVAEPFGLGHAHRVPLKRFAQDTGAELVIDGVDGVDDAGGKVRLASGGDRGFDALLVAPGGRPVVGVEGATTWWPGGDSESYGGLLRDLEEGYAKRLAIVVPPGAVWPLPAYELALMTAGEAREMGQEDVSITVVTPEHTPLSLFGEQASDALAGELTLGRRRRPHRRGGPQGGRRPRARADSGERLDVQRVFAVPRLVGPGDRRAPARRGGLHRRRRRGAGRRMRAHLGGRRRRRLAREVRRARDAPGATGRGGDRAAWPAATSRTPASRSSTAACWSATAPGAWRRRAAARARRCGGRTARSPASICRDGWRSTAWPLRRRPRSRPSEGVTIRRPLSAMRGAEAQYLFELSRQFRSADPAIASLGRRMREARER